ncbi:hypothetical protein QBC46DRAFT_451881 [Diplogelasinospora grovesii]|uniref:Short chain dehydrogenase n=1 Tax=Diplogelasinospora grovesii TaxID=303347 RepID=A0AAN6S200_9PEZI|nr:hypothetical protein QBC46DRAFT_451881 [Diplogelasinospora grovesii]
MPDQQKYIKKLAGDRVLVIGGSAGIGYGVAEACVEEGCFVIITGSSPRSSQAALTKLQSSYPSATARLSAFAADLADEDNLEGNISTLFESVSKLLTDGVLDHVVYTAGDALSVLPLSDVTLAKAKQAGMVRFFAPLLVAKHALPFLTRSAKGSLTLTTGGVASKPSANWTVVGSYATALLGLTRQLALDMRPVRVNAVAPGAVDTGLWKGLTAEQKEEMEKKTATGRVGVVEDVAQTYLGILKDRNTTGSVVETNSGYLLM